jgi:hypothetical protein
MNEEEKYFEIICVRSHTVLDSKGEIHPIKKGTKYTVRKFYDDFKVLNENTFIMSHQFVQYYEKLDSHRNSQINDILD